MTFQRMTRISLAVLLASGLLCSLLPAQAADYGGVALGATRVVYPQGDNQTTLSVSNTDGRAVFLVQSWVEGADGHKSSDFVITPPLFVLKPKKENTLRIMYAGPGNLPADRESLYWMNVKAIPAAAADVKGKNILQIAVLSRIKMFVRPKELPVKSIDAPTMLRFHRTGNTLTIRNPSPYYLTLVQFNAGTKKLANTMVPPKDSVNVALPAGSGNEIKFETVSDYGANTPEQKAVME